MGSKKALLLVAIIAVLASIPSAIAAQPKQPPDENAWQMLQLAYRAREKANQTIAITPSLGVSDEAQAEAQNAYAEGERLLALANQTFYALRGESLPPEGETPTGQRVKELARQAMQEFRTAIAAVMTETEPPEESPRGLAEAIIRAELYVAKVNASVEALRATVETEFDWSGIDGMIAQAELHIAYARGNLSEGDVNGTAHELGDIRRSLNGLQAELGSLRRSPKLEQARVGAFLEHQLSRKLDEARRLAEELQLDRTAELNAIEAKIQAAIQAGQNAQVEDALALTKEAHRLLTRLLNELHRGREGP